MEYIISLLVIISIYVILSVSFNLIIGYAGLMSIAHPIFFAIGAYTTAILSVHYTYSPIVIIIASGAVALIMSTFLSIPSLRISGDYFLITSIGFQLGLLEIIKNIDFLGGASGLGNIPNIIEGSNRNIYFATLTLCLAACSVFFVHWLIGGPYGRAIRAMRDDELAFVTLGRDAIHLKLSIFAIGSGMAGIAGSIFAYFYQYISLDQFELLQSTTILTMVVVGGMGSVWGPVVGAILLVLLPQAISFLHLPQNIMANLQGLIFSLLIILFLFLKPKGLITSEMDRAHEKK
ncbi:branched-chain amino acid ABC transporter permease [Castellaniella sp.]|uniref:branched-chain amino acid ABC transporter permease n=1 Tax=Castellaniella sp. TaxID=1955812 RepID=UPI0035618BAE